MKVLEVKDILRACAHCLNSHVVDESHEWAHVGYFCLVAIEAHGMYGYVAGFLFVVSLIKIRNDKKKESNHDSLQP